MEIEDIKAALTFARQEAVEAASRHRKLADAKRLLEPLLHRSGEALRALSRCETATSQEIASAEATHASCVAVGDRLAEMVSAAHKEMLRLSREVGELEARLEPYVVFEAIRVELEHFDLEHLIEV